jgi:CRP-like cAMP-binding protein
MITSTAPSALSQVNAASTTTQSMFEAFAGGPLPRWPEFASHVRLIAVEAGGTVFMQGAEHPYVYVVRRGLIKNVYLRDTGDSWIKSFSCEGGFFASIASLKPGGRTSFSAACVEDSELERIPFEVIAPLADSELAWSTVMRKALAIFADRKEQRERDLLTLTPEDRYRAVLAQQPDLERRITQKDLAAYLGITPVGLSRIVRRVKG